MRHSKGGWNLMNSFLISKKWSLLKSELSKLIKEHKGKYIAKGKILGIYDTIEEAFQAIKDVAKEGFHQ